MDAPFRRLVTRSCAVCDWTREAVEPRAQAVVCPQCFAPTKVMKQELLVPLVPGKNAVATVLSRLGASKGGKMRAERLSGARRREIARAAAAARWRRR
jgi:hypothetical protein